MSESKALLRRFGGKGGMLGVMARKYANNAQKSRQFLHELKFQMKTNRVRMERIWGKSLIRDLAEFEG